MTITRGLVQLKNLDKKISNRIRTMQLVGKDLDKDPKMAVQGVDDLIVERHNLRLKIMASNYVTVVTIGGKKVTVLEAILMKETVKYEHELLKAMTAQLASGMQQVERANARRDEGLLALLQASGGKEMTDIQVAAITEPFMQNNTSKLETGELKLHEEVEKRLLKIEEFLAEVDFTLSESNALTEL